MKLSFSTRGWPNLSFEEMLEVALDMGFSGVEVYNLAKFDPLLEKGGPFHKYNTAATVRQLREKGLSIPEDISIIGFNDTEMSSYTTPALTTISAPAYDMGQHGANLIYAATNLNINTPLKAKIPCLLVKRESCKKVN